MGNLKTTAGTSGAVLAVVFPGQGSQRKGMGADLFREFPAECAAADRVLGYSLSELCLAGDAKRLQRTEYTQPALFAVSALSWLKRRRDNAAAPALLAGHSLGEYTALFAADCFDFETGVRLVQKRGELMGARDGGTMAAVLGLPADRLLALLDRGELRDVDVAAYNAPAETVISGPTSAIAAAAEAIRANGVGRCVPLNVGAAFHSRAMAPAAAAYERFLQDVAIAEPRIPVVANVTARPHDPAGLVAALVAQITNPVRWSETMGYFGACGITELEEIGPGQVLTRLWQARCAAALETPSDAPLAPDPAAAAPTAEVAVEAPAGPLRAPSPAPSPRLSPDRLGCADFRRDYGLRYAYICGSMYQAIASTELVVRLGRNGLMGYFGTGGLSLDRIERAIRTVQQQLGRDGRYGMNLLHQLDDPALEQATVELFLRYGVRAVEAAAYMSMTAPLVHYRFKGAYLDAAGRPVAPNRVIAKVSRPETAQAFMRPPTETLLRELVAQGRLDRSEVAAARRLPVSEDVCVEADSGGHTDAGNPYSVVPAILALRDRIMAEEGYDKRIRVGAAGGIGTPSAAAAAFVLGADFVLTGSINQCSPEAGTSEAVKDLLAGLGVQDTAYAPAGDMFELGARVQVVRKGTLFAARANKLYELYRRHGAIEEIDADTRRTLEERYFKRSFDEVWRETCAHYTAHRPAELARAERDPRHKMALVFRWYFVHTARAARTGDLEEKANYQVHCGPAMGAFNEFIRGSALECWRERHVDVMAEHLMEATASLLDARLRSLGVQPT